MNEHIENYCIEYIESDFNPQFAILLKGEWGCGKTYFINKLISRYKNKNQKLNSHEIVYISLFGISDVSEINERLFQKMHPILSSDKFKMATGFIRSALSAGISTSSGNILNIGGIDLSLKDKVKEKELEKKLFIIDDIERTKLCPSQIFGYFSEYLYQLNIKLLFIGNEEKILKNNDEREDYFNIKEKTIGVEFILKPEIEKAVDSFIEEFSFNKKEKYIKSNCLETIFTLKCENLRVVRQCLYNYKLLYKSLGKDNINKNGNKISINFFNLFIQKSLRKIEKKDQVRDAIVGFDTYKKNYIDYIKLKEEREMIFDHYREFIPLESILADIIFDGDYSKLKIRQVYQQENIEKKVEKKKPLFILISDWRSLSKEEFKILINKVNIEFENGLYLHPGEILHYTNIMIIFSEWGLINETRATLTNKTKEIINKYKEKIIPINDWSMLGFSYAGWRYNNEIIEIKEMQEYLNNISNDNLFTSLKTTIKSEIINIKSDINTFCKNIIHLNGTGKYYGKPYLSLVNIEDFYKELVNLTIDEQYLIISAFEDRYGIIYSNGVISKEYKEDKENLIKLSKLYEASLGDIKYNPPELIKRDILKKLNNLVDYFEKQFVSNNNP